MKRDRKKQLHKARMRKYFLDAEKYEFLDYDKHRIHMYRGIRASSTKKKEPKTVMWIESCMKPGDVLYDIGANVGAFSLVAGKNRVKVYAFEPSVLTFVALLKNIHKNKLGKMVIPINTPLYYSEAVVPFHYKDIGFGESGHALNKNIFVKGKKTDPIMSQLMLTTTIDDFVFKHNMCCPNHLKIDVDGSEVEVLSGASKTLQNKNLKTILVEAMGDSDVSMTRLMSKHGFKFCKKFKTPVNCVYKRV